MKAYDVNTVEDTSIIHHQNPTPAFCLGIRWPVAITLIFAVVFYTIGGIICGFAYKVEYARVGIILDK
ncbi:hypothetical protein Avbf_14334 [Armadillidium vulgare]|nr:hypothetical protein Avbf_14334 [Armadillidium vulgare]